MNHPFNGNIKASLSTLSLNQIREYLNRFDLSHLPYNMKLSLIQRENIETNLRITNNGILMDEDYYAIRLESMAPNSDILPDINGDYHIDPPLLPNINLATHILLDPKINFTEEYIKNKH